MYNLIHIPAYKKGAIMKLKFKDETHKARYEELLELYNGGNANDNFTAALAYLIAVNDDTYKHHKDLYNIEERVIKPRGLHKDWQTGGSRKVTMLAFNLFTGSVNWLDEDDLGDCNPASIFNCGYVPYFFEAIKLYSNYFT